MSKSFFYAKDLHGAFCFPVNKER